MQWRDDTTLPSRGQGLGARRALPIASPFMCVSPSRYRSLGLNPRRARPPATTRAIQLTHIGIDQSPMMTVHSMKIRTRWNNATMAKITPATRENVFASMSHHPQFVTQDSTQGAGGCERRANVITGGLRHHPSRAGSRLKTSTSTCPCRSEGVDRAIQQSIAELSALTNDNK